MFVNTSKSLTYRFGYHLLNKGWRGAIDGDARGIFSVDFLQELIREIFVLALIQSKSIIQI